MIKPPLRRTVKMGCVGLDVEAHAIACHVFLKDGQLAAFKKQPQAMRRTFGVGKRTLAKKAAKQAALPQYGVIGPALYDTLWDAGAYNHDARKLLAADALAHAPKPRYVEPNQGFDSLDSSLWDAYTIGRNAGLTDLGTYNPASTLPGSGRKSDHAVYPAVAFDLGIDPDTGWNNLKARAYVQRIVGRKEIAYVILGDRIYSRRGWGRYYSGGHLNHTHVSGYRR